MAPRCPCHDLACDRRRIPQPGRRAGSSVHVRGAVARHPACGSSSTVTSASLHAPLLRRNSLSWPGEAPQRRRAGESGRADCPIPRLTTWTIGCHKRPRLCLRAARRQTLSSLPEKIYTGYHSAIQDRLDPPSHAIRLVGALLVDINDEMIAAERRYIAAASVADSPTAPPN